MKTTWRLSQTGKNTAAMNMAIDEALMLRQMEDALPTLRFYGWTRPSFSFGYFQKIAEEINLPKCRELGIDLVRRPTGGGTVIHGWDLTYSVAVPLDNPLIPKDTLESYRLISECIIAGLRQLDIKAEHYSERSIGDETLRNICLTNPTKYDVLIDSRKVAGAAQRRKQGVMLHQGYIALDMPPDYMTTLVSKQGDLSQAVTTSSIAINAIHQAQLDSTKLAHAIASGFEATLSINLTAEKLKAMEIDMATHLAKTKYAT
ncbi:MAG: biotin/lipoate A/B protein ligase family protein, partial [Candidatus Poribacteria bacterium]